MRILINHSNHPHSAWSEEQKRMWDLIIDLPFPNIPADAESHFVLSEVYKNIDKVKSIVEEYKNHTVYLYVAGEYTYCYLFILNLKEKLPLPIAIPTTERTVEERIKEDGTVEKISKFKFVQWRTCEL